MIKNRIESLETIAKELDMKTAKREALLKESRISIALSSKSIVNMHTGKNKDAVKGLEHL
ncbi:hypothetical protein ACFL96_19285 [Thermoproteota archaeon]